MSNHIRNKLNALVMAGAFVPFLVQADIVTLSGTLSAANQNGSNPERVEDPLGVVPTDAFGNVDIALDTDSFTLDVEIDVTGISVDELRSFGPNGTPIHLHLAGGGNPGNFGPIAVDLGLNAETDNFIPTDTGFKFSRKQVSILLEDQGGVQLGMHPGNDRIVDALQSGNAFVLVHTLKDIFINDTGPVPGFPFGEIRGNVTRTPASVKDSPAIGMDVFVLHDATDVPSAVATISERLKQRGFSIPLIIDHAANGNRAGLPLAPNQVIYARPPARLEKRLLARGETLGIDLPLKFQVFEQNGMVKMAVNTLGYLLDRHELDTRDFTLNLTDKLIEQFGTSGASGHGLVTVASERGFEDTVQALQDAIAGNPALVVPLVLDFSDQDKGRRHGKRRQGPVLIVFGNAGVGTPLMQGDPRMGIDLPLEFLVWEGRHGEVNITYSDPHFLAARVDLQGFDDRLNTIAGVLANFAAAGAGLPQ